MTQVSQSAYKRNIHLTKNKEERTADRDGIDRDKEATAQSETAGLVLWQTKKMVS